MGIGKKIKNKKHLAKKEGAPETVHIYIGVMSPLFKNQNMPRECALVLKWNTNMFRRKGNVNGHKITPHMECNFMSGWREKENLVEEM